MKEKEIQESLAETLKPILLQSTAHGIPRATRGPHWFRRVFWITVFMVCFLIFAVQTFYLTTRYLRYHVNTKLRVVRRQNVTWPSVTLCNLNKIDRLNVESYNRNLSNGDAKVDVKNIWTFSKDEIDRFGVQIDDFIIQCSFDSQPCTSDDFVKWQNDIYGNCFTFNHKRKKPVTSVREGSLYGLKLVLYTNVEGYDKSVSQVAGVRVSIHPRDVQPFPESEGFSVSTGTATFIRIHEKNFRRLSHPHGECNENTWPENMQLTKDSKYRYTTKACNKYCLAEFTYKKCNCSSSLIVDLPEVKPCNYHQEHTCLDHVLEDYSRGSLLCKCEVPCKEVKYKTTFSTANWPQFEYVTYFVRMLIREKGKLIYAKASEFRNVMNGSLFDHHSVHAVWKSMSLEFSKVEIYFDDLSIEDIYEESQLTFMTFLSNIGGTLGLWIGLSIISLVEGVEVIFYLLSWFYQIKIRYKFNDAKREKEKVMPGEMQSNGLIFGSTVV